MTVTAPEYMRIRHYILNRIYQAHEPEKLPSERVMREMFKVSRDTVRRAISDLTKEGIIISKPRQGNFIKPGTSPIGKTIGIIYGQGMGVHYSYNYLRIQSGICMALADRVAQAEFINLSSMENICEEIRYLSLDGLIWVNMQKRHFDYYYKLINTLHDMPVMAVTLYETPEVGNHIYNKMYKSLYLTTNYLIKQGHRKVMLAGYDPNRYGSNLCLSGYKQALQEYGIPFDPELVLDDNSEAPEKFRALMRRRPLILTAIHSSGRFSKMIHDIVHEENLKVPDDISLTTEEDLYSLQENIDFTRIIRPYYQMGSEAANKLLDITEGKITPPIQLEMDWILKKGSTCKKKENIKEIIIQN